MSARPKTAVSYLRLQKQLQHESDSQTRNRPTEHRTAPKVMITVNTNQTIMYSPWAVLRSSLVS